MKFKKSIFFGVFCLFFSGITLAAETSIPSEKMDSTLNLNKQQKSQIIRFNATAEQCMNNIDTSKYQPRLFLNMIKEGKVDETIFNQQIGVQNELHTQTARCRINYYTSISTMLTPAQKQKLLENYQRSMQ